MLQARKKITRKEMKKDPFFEKIDQGIRFYNRYSNYLYAGLAVVLLVVAIVYFIGMRSSTKEKQAAAAFGIAQQYVDSGDLESAENRLNEILFGNNPKDYKGLATYYLGYIAMERLNYDRALELFEEYLNNYHNQKLYNEAALAGIARIEEGRGDLVKAAEHYIKAAGVSESFRKDLELLEKAAYCYLRYDDPEKAEKIYNEMKADPDISAEFSTRLSTLNALILSEK